TGSDRKRSQSSSSARVGSLCGMRRPSPLIPKTALRPDIASVIAAAYHPVLPACDRDPSHAYRLAARTELS
ncbi:MAG: hypothetical protein EBR05_11730, partial [Marivivens sp.]|nr:hypothetical protein [Marivivens sp.]